jgi:membrane-bound lytic murein transglycosylase D
MLIRTTSALVAFILLAGCQSSRRHLDATAQDSARPDWTAQQAAYSSEDAPKSTESLLDAEAIDPDSAPHGTDPAMAEAEALYGNAVAANIDGRWHDAQVAFEQALAILGEVEIHSAADSADAEKLLHEIAEDYQTTLKALGVLDPEATSSAVLLLYDENKEIKTAPGLEAPPEPEVVEYNYPIEVNGKVRNCIVYYQTVAREPLEKFLTRAGRYLPMMKEIVASYGLPTDIAYLPLVESGFNNAAYSYAHAAGPWQFIASTGRRYGLNRTWWYDERRDFEKSTHAACQYLKELYGMFGDWNLALASYNGGEGRVGRQIKRQKTSDYWKLKLHSQTRNYVPLFMAALKIAREPERYGFHIEPDAPIAFDWVATNKALELKDVAGAIGCSLAILVELNPELRRSVTPPDIKPYRLRVPKGTGDAFAAAYKDLQASTRTAWVQHTVRRGETLSGLGRRYGVGVSDIVSANKLSSRHRIVVGQSLVIPVPMAYADNAGADPGPPAQTTRSSVGASGQRHTVKRGDSLWKLAKQFGTTTSAIRRANNMGAHSALIAGETITIPGRGESGSSFYYTIRRGDTMGRIASRFGVTIRQLLGVNSLRDPNRIIVGQRILIPQGL